MSREEAGLPRAGFVFACFNSAWKITPDTFDIWMRLLIKVEFERLMASAEQSGGGNPSALRGGKTLR